MSNFERISATLQNLLIATNGDSFVIFNDPLKEKFVQFCPLEEGTLWLDLPVISLDIVEFKRCLIFFLAEGLPVSEDILKYKDATELNGAARDLTFNAEFVRDVPGAARVTLAIFEQVLGCQRDFFMTVEENISF